MWTADTTRGACVHGVGSVRMSERVRAGGGGGGVIRGEGGGVGVMGGGVG